MTIKVESVVVESAKTRNPMAFVCHIVLRFLFSYKNNTLRNNENEKSLSIRGKDFDTKKKKKKKNQFMYRYIIQTHSDSSNAVLIL